MTPIFVVMGIFGMISLVLTANAQVEVKQSTTINGQTTSINTQDDKTTIKVLQGGTIQLTNDPKEFKIKYCESGCHTYKLFKNGTMTKEN
jgi:biopolymer transport protein ExbD